MYSVRCASKLPTCGRSSGESDKPTRRIEPASELKTEGEGPGELAEGEERAEKNESADRSEDGVALLEEEERVRKGPMRPLWKKAWNDEGVEEVRVPRGGRIARSREGEGGEKGGDVTKRWRGREAVSPLTRVVAVQGEKDRMQGEAGRRTEKRMRRGVRPRPANGAGVSTAI